MNTESTASKKVAMLDALKNTLGIISVACENAGVGRRTHYKWYSSDEEYRAQVDDVLSGAKDFVESKLMENIENGDVTSIIFYAKTKMKDRGYTERLAIDKSDAQPKRFNLIIKPDTP